MQQLLQSFHEGFQSQMRSRSTCDLAKRLWLLPSTSLFQSQMRSRSTCDWAKTRLWGKQEPVSISDEKPLHMRRRCTGRDTRSNVTFQSQMRSRSTCDRELQFLFVTLPMFQSQMRSRS